METKNFFKIGNKIGFKPTTEGLDYSLEAGKSYTVQIEKYTDEMTFEICPDIELPKKVYTTDEDDNFVKKVLNRYNKTTNGVVGVMLSGLKGSGKTVMMKRIAKESNLPVIIIDKSFYPSALVKLFNKLKDTEVCILMDEIDKLGENYDDDYLLKILDGINTSGKKLAIFTCNDEDEINDCLKDRCSRIRYWKRYEELPTSMIQNILEDTLKDKKEKKSLTDFIIENFGCISFDNVISFAEEVNEYPTDSFEDLFEDMNFIKK